MNAIILAGGKSSRMGSNKAFLKLKGKAFIEHQIDILKEVFNEIIISANTPSEYEYLKLPVIKDIYPEKGPLGGIYTGLLHSGSFHTFMLACDMPFVEVKLIKYLKEIINGYDAIVPKSDRGLEPLHAFYSKNCIEPIKKQLDNDSLRIISFFPDVKVKIVGLNGLNLPEMSNNAIRNLNTTEEYKSLGEHS